MGLGLDVMYVSCVVLGVGADLLVLLLAPVKFTVTSTGQLGNGEQGNLLLLHNVLHNLFNFLVKTLELQNVICFICSCSCSLQATVHVQYL